MIASFQYQLRRGLPGNYSVKSSVAFVISESWVFGPGCYINVDPIRHDIGEDRGTVVQEVIFTQLKPKSEILYKICIYTEVEGLSFA